MTRFSVAPIPPKDRSLHWSNFVSGIFFPMRASFSAPEQFHGTIENWRLGQISLSRFHSAPVCYDRARQHLRGRPEDDLLITFATKSDARFSQGDNVLHCRKDGFFIQRGDLPYQFSHAQDNELWVLKLPTQMLKNRIRVLDRYVSYVYDSSRGAGALFLDTARSIPHRMDQFGAVTREGLGHCLVELLCLALEDDERALGSGMSSVRLGHLTRIERHVRKNLANHAMTIEEVAVANGISRRYLHELFKGSDRTIGQWIRTLRLEAALADLQDPRHGETVAEIAYRWGFGDQAQFSRHFKSHFGKTPREIRLNSLRSVTKTAALQNSLKI
jgi:AraC-like DNA-binding protein